MTPLRLTLKFLLFSIGLLLSALLTGCPAYNSLHTANSGQHYPYMLSQNGHGGGGGSGFGDGDGDGDDSGGAGDGYGR